MTFKPLALLAATTAFFFCGCSTYVAISNPKVDLGKYHKIFVYSNLDDNHHLDILLVQALKAQGRDADSGPPTMMPEDAEAIVSYQDHWSWDFSDHLSALNIEMADARNNQPIGKALYSGPASMNTPVQEVVNRMVKEMLNHKPRHNPNAVVLPPDKK